MEEIITGSRHLALFDMDGTLLAWDTQVLFAGFVFRRFPWRRLLLFPFICCLPLAALHIWGDGRMKRIFLSYLWRMPGGCLKILSDEFAREVVSSFIDPGMKRRLDVHRANGDVCVMATASPSFYADRIAGLLGFDMVLSTIIETGSRVSFFPLMPCGNNKGERKVERLLEMGIIPNAGERQQNVFAYSDSSADLPMLRLAQVKILVNPSSKLCLSSGSEGTEIVEIFQPWHSKVGKIWKYMSEILGF